MEPCDSHPTTFFGLLLKSRSSSSCNSHESHQLLRDFVNREFNAFLWVSLIVITFLFLTKVVKLFRLWYKAKKIPGIPCPSFFGHCKLLFRENLTNVLSESHKKYGPIVKLWLGPTQLLVSVKDPVLIHEMLIKAQDKMPFTGKAFCVAFGQSSLFGSSFNKVHKKRELLATKLNERLLENSDLIPTKVVGTIMDKIENIRTRGSIDCRLVSQHMAFTLMGATLFGDGFLAWPNAGVYEELLMMISKDACIWASYNVTPFWKQGFWRYQNLCTKLKCLTQDILQHCKKNCKLFHHIDQYSHYESSNIETEAEHGAKHCSDAEIQDHTFFRELSDHHTAKEEPCGNIMRVMCHGCQTTAALVANLLTMLVMYPEIQDKVYSEITMTSKKPLKDGRRDVYRMPLLLATIYESARLLPTGPLLQRSCLKHDLSFATGQTIPAGAALIVPVQLVQMDDSSWGSDAGDFNPFRFLSNVRKGSDAAHDTASTGFSEENMNPGFSSFVLNNPNENAAFLPFGSGSRACIGQKFVIQVVATLFASILEKYEIRLHSVSEGELIPGFNNHHLPNSPIVFMKRASS